MPLVDVSQNMGLDLSRLAVTRAFPVLCLGEVHVLDLDALLLADLIACPQDVTVVVASGIVLPECARMQWGCAAQIMYDMSHDRNDGCCVLCATVKHVDVSCADNFFLFLVLNDRDVP